jgi:hydrogenase expression/formation protein HypC
MCLAVPGQVLSIDHGSPVEMRIGTIDMQGNRIQASLALTPDAGVGDWVLMHAGYAIERITEEDAREIWSYLDEIGAAQAAGEPESTES